jgi:hypothetical protein
MNFNKSLTELLSELCRFPSEHKIIRLPEEVASHSTLFVESGVCVDPHNPTREAKMRAWIYLFLSQIWSNSVEGMTPTLYDGQCSSSSQQCPQKGVGSVALESTVISHGLPYPENLELQLVPAKNGCWQSDYRMLPYTTARFLATDPKRNADSFSTK